VLWVVATLYQYAYTHTDTRTQRYSHTLSLFFFLSFFFSPSLSVSRPFSLSLFLTFIHSQVVRGWYCSAHGRDRCGYKYTHLYFHIYIYIKCQISFSKTVLFSDEKPIGYQLVLFLQLITSLMRGGGLGSSTTFKNWMSSTPRRKWYLTTRRRAH